MKIRQKPSISYSSPISIEKIARPASVTAGVTEQFGTSVYGTFSSSDSYNDYNVVYELGVFDPTNETPDVFSASGGMCTRIKPGIGRLRLDGRSYSRTLSLDFRSSSETSFRKLLSFSNGSVGKFAFDVVHDLMVDGKDIRYYNGDSFSVCEGKVGGIARNPDCWAAGYDLSGVAVFYLWGGFNGGGALVTRRHYLCSWHFENRSKKGNKLVFLGSDGNKHTRTIIAETTGIGIPNPLGRPYNPSVPVGDLTMFLLSEDLPASVCSYAIAGDWIAKPVFTGEETHGGLTFGFYSSDLSSVFIVVNQKRNAVLQVVGNQSNSTSAGYLNGDTFFLGGVEYPNMTKKTFTLGGVTVTRPGYGGVFRTESLDSLELLPNIQTNLIPGDSGSPVFYPLSSNSLALFTVATYPNSGTAIYKTLVDAMIADVDANAGITTGYKAQDAASPIP